MKGDTGAYRATWRDTHKGQLPNLPGTPTVKQVAGVLCGPSHFVEGKIIERWYHGDTLGLFQQLGLVPPMGGGGFASLRGAIQDTSW